MTKPNREQELNVLYQVCIFLAHWKTNMATLVSDWPRHYRLLSAGVITEFDKT